VIFVDTSAWYAIFTGADANHLAASQLLVAIKEPLVTSDFVVDETLTLFRARGEVQRALSFGIKIIDDGFAEIVRITPDDFARAWQVFRRFADKRWSFTDCTSRVVMERLGIQCAFAFDDHFRQLGTVTVIP
jgi:predicted nucleic acid-binding protein